SGRQDHTILPSADQCRSSPTSLASIASRTQRRDDAQRPSCGYGKGADIHLICISEKQKFFCAGVDKCPEASLPKTARRANHLAPLEAAARTQKSSLIGAA